MFDRVLNKAIIFTVLYLVFTNEGHHWSSVVKKFRFDSSDFFQSLNFTLLKMQTLIVFVIEKHLLYTGMQPEILWAGEVL